MILSVAYLTISFFCLHCCPNLAENLVTSVPNGGAAAPPKLQNLEEPDNDIAWFGLALFTRSSLCAILSRLF
jgi:hypothetical protein